MNQLSSLRKTKTSTHIDRLLYNNNELSETADICKALNNYFFSVGPTLVQSLTLSGHDEFKTYCRNYYKNSMFCSPVTPDEIVRIIHLPNNKSPGRYKYTQRYLRSLHCTLAMNKLRSVTTTAEYIQTVCPHYSALCPRKPGVLVYI